jgi:hypothetical protein
MLFYFRNNISFLIKSIMVTTGSHHINNNHTRDPISVSVDDNPITTQNIIMTPTTAPTAPTDTADTAAAAATTTTAAATAPTVTWTLDSKLNDADV